MYTKKSSQKSVSGIDFFLCDIIAVAHGEFISSIQALTELQHHHKNKIRGRWQFPYEFNFTTSGKPTSHLYPGELPYIGYTGMCHQSGSTFWASKFRTIPKFRTFI